MVRRAPTRPPASAPSAPRLEPPLPLRAPAVWVPALIAALCVAASVTFRISDTDFWQHLAVGRAIWRLHEVPQRHLWSWPTLGQHEVLPSWGFRALVWPFWDLGGLGGLYAWRWITALVAFTLAWVTARRMGATGLSSLAVFVLCALVYRQRSQVRPETFAAVLLALTLFVLESRRAAIARGETRGDHAWWLVAIALVWANAHISYWLGLALLGIHLLDAARSGPRERAGNAVASPSGATGRLALVALACVAVSFLNPFGWEALVEPARYLFTWRHEAVYRSIGELKPPSLDYNARNGLPLLMLAWPALLVRRIGRRGLDLVETLCWLLFTTLALTTQRFLSLWALVAAPYLARDLDEWVRARRWPVWTRPPASRAALAVAACLLLCPAELARPDLPPGIAIEPTAVPAKACDWIAAHEVRGRAFNHFELGGYLLFRFWPDTARLPFMDIHQSGTMDDRLRYVAALAGAPGWRALDAQRRFDWVLLRRLRAAGDRLADVLDADSSWALVFADDAALVYLRREGRTAALADSFRYRIVPGGTERLESLGPRWQASATERDAARAELARMAEASPLHSTAASLLANLAAMDGRYDEARARLEEAHRIDPEVPNYHYRLGLFALRQGRPGDALVELERQRRAGPAEGLDDWIGVACERLGDRDGARRAYRRALARDPGDEAARRALEALEAPR